MTIDHMRLVILSLPFIAVALVVRMVHARALKIVALVAIALLSAPYFLFLVWGAFEGAGPIEVMTAMIEIGMTTRTLGIMAELIIWLVPAAGLGLWVRHVFPHLRGDAA
ncbi:hypothetical protein ABMC88_11065 [Sulfitobacter sp. HNIBRBA2951]|uniref:hypothetical protein n=1 Tax=Sulfitobacter aquimarinus TaxID=3158557 RepID=UPI0032DF792C